MNVVAISGGKDSTAMALRLQEVEPELEPSYLITPTGDELPAMVAHWERLESMLGDEIQTPILGASHNVRRRERLSAEHLPVPIQWLLVAYLVPGQGYIDHRFSVATFWWGPFRRGYIGGGDWRDNFEIQAPDGRAVAADPHDV